MDGDTASTATQAKSGMTRRGVMRKAAIGTGATLGVGYGAGRTGAIGGASAIAPIVVGSAAGGAALGYLVQKGADLFLGDSRDYSGYTGIEALKTEVRRGVRQMQSANERVMTSIQNNVVNSQNVAFAKGKSALVTKMNAEAPLSEAETAMESAISAYYATIEENILTHSDAQIEQLNHMIGRLGGHPDYNLSSDTGPFKAYGDLWAKKPIGPATVGISPYTLADGTEYNYNSLEGSWNGNKWDLTPINGAAGYIQITGDAPNLPYDGSRFKTTLDEIKSKKDDVISQLSGFASDVYDEYGAGDIPTEDIIDPATAATELGQSYGGDAAQSASASMLGIPTSAEQAVMMDVHRPDGTVTIQADMYTKYTPASGSFETGTRYVPAEWTAPLYIAYEYTAEDGSAESDFAQLKDPFTIREISVDGEEVNTFKPETRNTQTADVSKIEEELAQIRKEQIRLQNEAEESAGGAGAGFFDGSGPNTGVIAAVVGGIGVLYALTQGGPN